MFIFIRLVLGHLIGDFVFQFDRVHALKVKGPKGLLLHVGIVMGCLLMLCWPYLDQPITWLFLLFIGLTHYIQDWAKIRLTSHSKHQLFFFFFDQVVHIAFLATVFGTVLRTMGPWANPGRHLLQDLYNNNTIILYFITAFIASYAGHYSILLLKKDFFKSENSNSVFEKWYGFMERILIVSVIFPGIPWPVLIPVILAFRPILFKSMKTTLLLSDQFSSKTEIILSGVFATVTGIIFYIGL
jgi:hypothetical protein